MFKRLEIHLKTSMCSCDVGPQISMSGPNGYYSITCPNCRITLQIPIKSVSENTFIVTDEVETVIHEKPKDGDIDL